MTLAMLVLPHANIRYRQSIHTLSEAELVLLCAQIPTATQPRAVQVNGLSLFCIDIDEAHLAQALAVLRRHSSCQAVFRMEGEALYPLEMASPFAFGEDIAAILKYKGKTNERFTAMLINVAVFSSGFAADFATQLSLVDPMCGRGTTLLEGLRVGYNVAGIECAKADVQEFNRYLKSYLTYHKHKHGTKKASLTKQGKAAGDATIYSIDGMRTCTLVRGDTLDSDALLKPASAQALVADLPYGVQHRGMDGKKRAQLDTLMKRALPLWHDILAPGGAAVLSFNAHAVDLHSMRQMMQKAGFTVLQGGAYDGFRHWVEQAVDRDIVVGVR